MSVVQCGIRLVRCGIPRVVSGEGVQYNLIFRFSISTIVYQARYLVPVPVLVGTSGTIVLVAGSSSIFFSQKTKNPTLNYMYVVQNDMYL